MLCIRVLIATGLYVLQGVIQGLTSSIPLFLASNKASWKQQSIFQWAPYPFSLKILWAPIIDSIYVRRLGRHQTWLVPIEMLIGILLLLLSFHLDYLLNDLQVVTLTIIFVVIYFLTATHDIVVDGWTLSLFATSNLQWSSTSQTIGQTLGMFFGSSVLMSVESSNFTNKYIRQPLALPQHSYGLFTIEQFTRGFGVTFLVSSILISIIFFWKRISKKTDEFSIGETKEKCEVLKTYLAIWQLCKKPCLRTFIIILLTSAIGFAATGAMSRFMLIQYGITRETLGLLSVPLFLIQLVVPMCLCQIRRPLKWFARGYIPSLIICVLFTIYVLITPQILEKFYFYPILIVLSCISEVFSYVTSVSTVGFFARISDPSIGGTYMTLLATMANIGKQLSSVAVLYIANWLPNSKAYWIESTFCLLFGFLWISFVWKKLQRLEELPIESWYLEDSTSKSVDNVSLHTTESGIRTSTVTN